MKDFRDYLPKGSQLIIKAPFGSFFTYLNQDLMIKPRALLEGTKWVPGFMVEFIFLPVEEYLRNCLIHDHPQADEIHTIKYNHTDDFFFMYTVRFPKY